MTTGTAPDPSAAAVAGLARTVEALERRVDQLTALPARVEELAGLLARLADATATAVPAASSPPPAPTVSWLDHPADPGRAPESSLAARAAEDLLTGLTSWVDGIYLRYSDALRGLPECWLWHPDIVEELVWLRAAWLDAYRPTAPASAVGDWHDRLRPGVACRIHDYAGYCSLEAHQPGRMQGPAIRLPVPGRRTVTAIAGWWTTSRHQRPPIPGAPPEAPDPRHGR